MAEPNYYVYLELQRRADLSDESTQVNRIPLAVTEIGVNSNKTVPNIGVPFSGAVAGESLNLAFDMGLTQKTLSLTGILLDDQTIIKKKPGETSATTVTMTVYELAQLIHSYVDASSFQDDQNINKIIILIPSKVDDNFTQRGSTKLIPFTFKNRKYDNDFTSKKGDSIIQFTGIDDLAAAGTDIPGVTGFIRSFTTQLSGAEHPSISFTLEFEQAMVIADNFFD